MTKRIIGPALLAMLISAAATAQQGLLNPRVLEAIDENGDGAISAAELEMHAVVISTLMQNFSQADQNADGIIDQAEFAAIEIVPEGHPDTAPAPEGGPGGEPGL